ncbi:MAG: hypothetical protein IPN80_02950 [Flavobacterium sp.]|jgi:hypothetical protein|nr:hypothetical protein [Flavobacterium sp.]
MKNLFGAVAPTNRVLGSFKVLMLILLVTIGFTSCKDQSKSEVSQESEFNSKTDFQNSQNSFDISGNETNTKEFLDIGGNQVPPGGFCEPSVGKEIGKVSDIGGKNSNGGLEKPSDTGGRGNQGTTSEYTISDIGGKGTSSDTGQIDSPDDLDDLDTGGRGTNTNTGEYSIADIGGRSTTGEYSICDTGGKNSNGGLENPSDTGGRGNQGTTGEYTISDTGGSKGGKGTSTGGEYYSSDIGGRGGVEPPGGIDINLQPSTTEKNGCMLRDF